MKTIYQIVLTVLLTAGIFCAVLYSSCSKDLCKGMICGNGGTCGGGNCTCPMSFTGAYCLTLTFVGTWQGAVACGPFNTDLSSITITFNPTATNADTVLINNAGGFGDNFIGILSYNGDTITYTNQVVNPSLTPDTLSGTMVLTDSTHFTHLFTVRAGTNFSHSCSGIYTK